MVATADRPVGAKTVDEYLSMLDPKDRKVLERLRQQIKAAAPEAQETISYGIPTYRHHGPLLHFAKQPKHLAIYGPSLKTLKDLRNELAGFDVSGRTIRFNAERPLPARLVKEFVRRSLRERMVAQRSNLKTAAKRRVGNRST